MNTSTIITENAALNDSATTHPPSPSYGKALEIGSGFSALTFRAKEFPGAMDPLVMVDHYRMTKPTFGPHPHAGLSAVTVLFEDSTGTFHNRDSLGNDFDLLPGDLYWLKAGSGVIHDESPRAGANIHGLQVFVNLPAIEKKRAPKSLHVKAENMPLLENGDSRVRVVLGESNGVAGQQSPALPMTILDGHIHANSFYSHPLREEENAWIYAIEGELIVMTGGKPVRLLSGQAIAISGLRSATDHEIHLFNKEAEPAHFALFSAEPINEVFVQKGPFVMSSEADIAQIEADYAAGKLGHLAQ